MADLSIVQPSPTDRRDKIASFQKKRDLHSHVDLLPDVEEVENQFQTGSCTANAAASALEIAYKRANQSKDFSRLYNYWYSRSIGNIKGDDGAYPRDVCKALNKYGICLESTWKFDIQNNLHTEPSSEAQQEALLYPIHEYSKLESLNIIDELKCVISSGIPVMTSIKISKKFNSLESDWKKHDWDPSIDFIGAHQVLIIGYDDHAQRFLVQNSWGNIWGDGGFFGIPYSRIGQKYEEKDKSAYEYWILSKLDVPYYDATGKETEPLNIIEANREKANRTKNIVAAILIAVISVFLISILK